MKLGSTPAGSRDARTTIRAPLASLVPFLFVVVGGGLLIGALARPDEWYEGLEKPWFNPPNWLFGPVWTTLYVMVAIAGWRVWARRRELGKAPWGLWCCQLAANFLWSPTFFAAHRIDIALGIISMLLVAIVAFIAVTLRRDGLSAALFVPYALWVSFATILNGALYGLNGAG